MALWDQLFPDEDFRFHMGLRKGDPAAFYAPTAVHTTLTAERRHWLETDPESYLCLAAPGLEPLEEILDLASDWRTLTLTKPKTESTPLTATGAAPATDSLALHRRRCGDLAKVWEPDFILLAAGLDGVFRVAGGAVCFPSWWSLPEKLGLPVEQVHSVVPGLNAALGRQISAFLGRLAPGVSWERENWGLARTPELNLHPRLQRPRLVPPLTAADVWLRVEYQSFVALPQSRGVLFGIRLHLHSLAEIVRDRPAATRLRRALETMDDAVARYKGLADSRGCLIRLLAD